MSRMLVLIAVLALAACDQAVAPSTRLDRPNIQAGSNPFDDVIRDNFQINITGTIQDPCSGETIALDGSTHIVMTLDETSTGATLNYHSNTQGVTGVGLQTGTQYQFIQLLSQGENAVFIPANGSGTVVVHERIVSNGSADNFLGDIGYTFTFPPFVATYTFQNLRCQG